MTDVSLLYDINPTLKIHIKSKLKRQIYVAMMQARAKNR